MSDRPAILWFTNDLRMSDNAALTRAVESGRPILPVFILDDQVAGKFAMGGASRWWLMHSLEMLGASIKSLHGMLVLKRGASLQVLTSLIEETGAEALYFSRNHAPWSAELEKSVFDLCAGKGVECKRFSGFLLHEPEAIKTGSDTPYKVYTPFSRNCFDNSPARAPRATPQDINFYKGAITSDELVDWQLYSARPDWASGFGERWQPGEAGAHNKLERFISQAIKNYHDARDIPGTFGTSRLSPHLHFGEISPLQCWHAARHAMDNTQQSMDAGGHTFLKELLWREFSYHLLHYWPDLPEKAFKPEFQEFPWRENGEFLEAWQKGQTGYPIVDAGMRELWATGWMHNRVRMIVASFLIKNLNIPWQSGERWFWDTLVDADIGSNSASWQWVAGCGADAAPFFRIFNPVLQGERFDPEGNYVRTWVPEIAKLPTRLVHKPWEAPALVLKEAGIELGKTYPTAMVDLYATRDQALAAYKSIRN
ncbi:MAG: deoxyribodipyrimidine photo-lyase [Anderseniella sp.]